MLIETRGFDALDETMNKMAYQDKRKIILNILGKAVQPLSQQAQANAPRKGGNLRESIGVIKPGIAVGDVFVRVGARTFRPFKGYHGFIVEEGTVERHYMTKKGVQHNTGKMRYTGFFDRAVRATEQKAIDYVANEWYNTVARFEIKSGKDK